MLFEKKESLSENTSDKRGTLYPTLFFLCLYPLIVRNHNFLTNLDQFAWFPASERSSSDLFLFYKSIALIIVAAIMCVIIIYQVYKKKVKLEKTSFLFPLGAYAFFIILSTLFSKNYGFSLKGAYGLFESVWILLGYLVILYYSYLFVHKEEAIQFLIKGLMVGMGIMALIGVFQTFGIDYLNNPLIKLITTGSSNTEIVGSFEKNRVSTTLFNPNYVGVYSSLLFPISVGYIWISKSKRGKILSLLISCGLVVSTFGAQSKTGLAVLLVSIVIMLLLFRKKIKRYSKWLIVSVIGLIIIFFIINATQNNAYLNSIKNIFSNQPQEIKVQSIETNEEYVKVIYKNEEIYIKCELDEEGKLLCIFLDSAGVQQEVTIDQESMRFALADPHLNDISLVPINIDEDNNLGFQLYLGNQTYSFRSKNDTNGYEFKTEFDTFVECKPSKGALFNNHTTLASGRGYIWSRTLPLLKDTLIYGSGPDTFILKFPQTDYAGKYSNGFGSQFISKPHNMYLQIAVQTGVFSLISFLAIYLIYFIESLRLFAKCNYKTYREKIGVFIFIGTVGYMISGLINDSTITVAPVFWTLLGIGFACNNLINKQNS